MGGAAILALHERVEVVHPRVVRAQLAAARPAPCARSTAPERSPAAAARRRRICSGASSTLPDGVRSTSGMRGWSGPRSTPCGLSSSRAGSGRRGPRRTRRRRGPTRSSRSSIRSGPRRGSSSARISAWSRPAMREWGSPSSRPTSVAMTMLVERIDVGVRTLAGHDSREACQRHPLLGHPVRAEARRASSWPRCAPRAGRAPCRSAASRAGRARAGSRRRGGVVSFR